MPCYYPLPAVQQYPGSTLQVFSRKQRHLYKNLPGRHFEIPCNQCSGCRRRQSLNWAMRCEHEIKTHRYNSYITLTFDEQHLRESRSLNHKHFQRFIKALRKALSSEKRRANLLYEPRLLRLADTGPCPVPHVILNNAYDLLRALKTPARIRYYMAGEYGELYGRPHYHALLFGLDFADKVLWKKTNAEETLYRSPTLEKLWPYGYSTIGTATFASAAYIARYILQKRTGDNNKDNYHILDLDTGEIKIKKKEYNQMSRNAGIGHAWLTKYKDDVYHTDTVITSKGKKLRPPRYYDKLYKKMDAAHLEQIKLNREREALQHAQDHTDERLAVQEIVANANAQTLLRNLKGET